MVDELHPLGAPEQDEGRVDELFTGKRPAQARPTRSKQIGVLLASALVLNLAGLLSCTLVPGTLLTLWARHIVRQELAILEHGELPVLETLRLTRQERFASLMLLACGVMLVAQVYLLSSGFYQRLLLRFDLWLAGG
jgi:hypothetical protein